VRRRAWQVAILSGSLALSAGVVVMGAERVAISGEAERAYRAGKAAPNDREARREYQRGIDVARDQLKKRPDDPAALLWLAANLGGEALTHGRLHALGVISDIEATLLRLDQQHPDYDHAAAARALGNLYWKAPALISVGSTRKATSYFLLALGRASDFPGNQALAAAFFADNGDCARARPLALAVESRGDLAAIGLDAAEWKQLAAQALARCR
jgi:hypothetical protein